MGEADHVDGASRGYGFLPSAIGIPSAAYRSMVLTLPH